MSEIPQPWVQRPFMPPPEVTLHGREYYAFGGMLHTRERFMELVHDLDSLVLDDTGVLFVHCGCAQCNPADEVDNAT